MKQPRSLLIVSLVLSFSFILCSSCSNASSAQYEILLEDYEELRSQYDELRVLYEELDHTMRYVYEDCLVEPYDLSQDIAYKHDNLDLFPPSPSVEDLDTILYCYIEGEEDVTRAEARQAYAAYQEYAACMASKIYLIKDVLNYYYGD